MWSADRAVDLAEDKGEEEKMYECFHCGARAVTWDADFDFEDYGYGGEGIIHECHCNNCGALVTYAIPLPDADGGEGK